MKKQTLLLGLFLLISTLTFAQAKKPAAAKKAPAAKKTAYIKYEVNGKAFSYTGEEGVETMNTINGDGVEQKKHTENFAEVGILQYSPYQVKITINTAPRTKPVVCKMPYVQSVFPIDGYIPSVHIDVIQNVGKEAMNFYGTELLNHGTFEITKVEGDWVEGKFELVVPNSFVENDSITITNGTFLFKIPKELKMD